MMGPDYLHQYNHWAEWRGLVDRLAEILRRNFYVKSYGTTGPVKGKLHIKLCGPDQ